MEHSEQTSYIKTVSALSKQSDFYIRVLAFAEAGNMISVMLAIVGLFVSTLALSFAAMAMVVCSLFIYQFARRRLNRIYAKWEKINDDQLQYIADMINKPD